MTIDPEDVPSRAPQKRLGSRKKGTLKQGLGQILDRFIRDVAGSRNAIEPLDRDAEIDGLLSEFDQAWASVPVQVNFDNIAEVTTFQTQLAPVVTVARRLARRAASPSDASKADFNMIYAQLVLFRILFYSEVKDQLLRLVDLAVEAWNSEVEGWVLVVCPKWQAYADGSGDESEEAVHQKFVDKNLRRLAACGDELAPAEEFDQSLSDAWRQADQSMSQFKVTVSQLMGQCGPILEEGFQAIDEELDRLFNEQAESMSTQMQELKLDSMLKQVSDFRLAVESAVKTNRHALFVKLEPLGKKLHTLLEDFRASYS